MADGPSGDPAGIKDGTWGPAELAAWLGYAERTVKRMVSEEPHKLPPRIRATHKPRWLPEVVYEWAREQSRPIGKVKMGRPRNSI